LGGVVALAIRIFILYFLSIGSIKINIPSRFNFFYQVWFWVLVVNFLLLTWLGACPIENPYLLLAGPLTYLYFFSYPILLSSRWLRFIILK
jgi:ubiquinol-cytochrome c reductase cytochrome b subunit